MKIPPCCFWFGLSFLPLISGVQVHAADGIWNAPAGGNWWDGGNWTETVIPGVLDAVDNADRATFGSAGGDGTVSVDEGRNVFGITFGTRNYTLSGGRLVLSAGGDITGTSGSLTIENNIELRGNATFSGSGTGGGIRISGNITGTAGTTYDPETEVTSPVNYALALAGTGLTNEINGVISDGTNGGTVSLVRNTGLWILSNANTYTGGTTLSGGSGTRITRVTHGKALGTGNVTIGATSTASQNATLQLAGGINLDLGAGNRITTSGGSATATNPHIENLSGDNSYLGEIYSLGPLVIRSTDEDGKITLGTINLNYSSGASDSAGARPFRLDGAGDGEITGRVYNSGSRRFNLTKNGTGTWTFSNSGTGTANRNQLQSITANAGTLRFSEGETHVNGGIVVNDGGTLLLAEGATFTGSGAINVNEGGTFGGQGNVGNATTFNAGSFLTPAGVTTFASTVDISGLAGGTDGGLLFQLGAVDFSDKVVLSGTGALTIGDGTLDLADFSFTALAGFGEGTYTLFSAQATIVGTLGANLTGTLGGYAITLALANDNRDIMLISSAIPEPSVYALLCGALTLAGALVCRRRRL